MRDDFPSPADIPELPAGGTGEVTGPQQVLPRQVQPVVRLGQQWRHRAASAVRGVGPPTIMLGTATGGDDQVSQRQARAVIDLALRVGEAMLSTGATAADSVATVLRLVNAYGVRSVHVDVTFTSMSISIHRGLYEDPLSVMRGIQARSPDYSRGQSVQQLIDQIVDSAAGGAQPMDIDTARVRLMRVLQAPHPYRRWVVTAGASILALGVVMLYGAQPAMWVVAAISAAMVDRAQRRLSHLGVARFFAQVASAAVPALLALALFWTAQHGFVIPGIRSPALVVISGIVVLLAGLGMLGAAQDALDGYYVTAGARVLEVVLMTLGIGVGVAIVLGIANRFGIAMEVSPVVVAGGSFAESLIGAVLIALGFCLTTYTTRRSTLLSMAVAALAWVVFDVSLRLGLGSAGAAAIAATLVGVLAFAAHRQLRIPQLAVATAAIVPMLPGLAVYKALYHAMASTAAVMGNALVYFTAAVAIGLALAAGLSLGDFLARRSFGLDLASQRARRRSTGAQAEES